MQSKRRFCVAAIAVALAACGGAQETKKAAAPAAPALPKKPPEVFQVHLQTTKGKIVIEVHRAWAPHGADHFYELVNARFYDGAKFYRVLKRFVAQFGINGNPKFDEVYASLRIPDDPVKEKNRKGTVTFAKLGPNTRTTEVFINLADNAMLDTTGFVPFGRIVEGLEVAGELSGLYGEVQPKGGGPDPAKIHQIGNKYLEMQYPRLDAIERATVVLKP